MEFRIEDRTGDIHLGVTSMWIVLKAMKLNEIFKGISRNRRIKDQLLSPGVSVLRSQEGRGTAMIGHDEI